MQDPSVRPTLATVAKLAGVSVASVSRVLNGMPALTFSVSIGRSNAAGIVSVAYRPDW